MKKFIILTLMCALLAGAAFAQGWSVSGQGELGTMLNFVGGGYEAIDETKAQEKHDGDIIKENSTPITWIGANGYHNIAYYGYIGGLLGIRYNNSGLSAGFDFVGQRAYGGGYIGGDISYSSAIAQFQYYQSVIADSDSLLQGKFAPDRLWGLYKLMDGKITLEAAAASRDANFWYSNGSVNDIFGGGTDVVLRAFHDGDEFKGNINFDDTFGMGFTKVDHHNYLLADFALIDGLKFGFMFPSVFAFNKAKNTYEGGHTQVSGNNNSGKKGYYDAQGDNAHVDFVYDTLLKSRIGAQFASGPINVALQFALLGVKEKMIVTDGDYNGDGKITDADVRPPVQAKDAKNNDIPYLKKVLQVTNKSKDADDNDVYAQDAVGVVPGLYLGASYAINDQISAGLSFQGHFWSQKPILGVAANVGFGAGNLNAGLALGLYTEIDPTERFAQTIVKSTDIDPDAKGTDTKHDGSESKYWYPISKSNTSTNDKLYEKAEVITSNFTLFAVKPGVTYAIVENYLAAGLDAALYFNVSDNLNPTWSPNQFGYEVTPQLFFNVAGTGAAANYYGGLNTAIIIRYKVAGWVDGKDLAAYKKQFVSYKDVNGGTAPGVGGNGTVDVFTRPMYNGLDITFKWSF